MIAHPQAIPPDGRHRYTVRVYYEDTDAGGVVYHANYLRFAERARTEALRDMGIPHAELVERHRVMFVVRRAEVDYLRAARPDDSLVIETAALEVGGATVVLRQTVCGPEGPCAVLRVRLACVQVARGEAVQGELARGQIPGEEHSLRQAAQVRAERFKPGRIPPRWRHILGAMRDRLSDEGGAPGAGSLGVQGSGSNG